MSKVANSFRLTDQGVLTPRIRDPFVLADPATRTYYLCTSLGKAVGVYTSKDLETWQGPTTVYEIPPGFWAQRGIWAPEMHAYQDRFYLFLTCSTDDRLPGNPTPAPERPANWPPLVKRGSQVLVADSPLGPFRPFHNRAHTPADKMTLDGTLWVEDGVPTMVYCHEWVQMGDGTVEAMRLAHDLSDVVGDPVTLFRGSDAARVRPGQDRYVTDGPFLYRTRTGRLLMLWSTFGLQGYMTIVAASESGTLHGPWAQQPRPLFAQDGGHAMVFRDFGGRLMLILHHPNRTPNERALLFELEDRGDTLSVVHRHPSQYPFADPAVPIEERIGDILTRMTLDEKVACLGTVPNVPRLGIWGSGHVEGLHGLAMGGPGGWGGDAPIPTTQFPQAIGLGETWDPDLIQRAAAIEGYEARYVAQSKAYERGGLVVRAPNADLGRDIRWGRTEECYGEDPYLNGTLVTAFVRGLQGNDPRYWQTASLLKHFLANSNEDERVRSSSDFDERLLREYYSAPFRMGISEGGARAFMAAYNAYNGIPCTVHPILRDITVDEWGQDGIICTDAGALTMLVTEHRYYPDPEMAAAASIKAGINQFLDRYREGTEGALASGLLTEANIDASLRGVFRVMMKLGLLDPPDSVPYSAIGQDGEPEPWLSERHRAFARLVTQRSIVLLKNAGALLPLDRTKVRSIAVIGPRADEVLLDWYSGTPPYTVTPFAGIQTKVGERISVTYVADNEGGAAARAARAADVAIVCVGNHPTGDAGWAQCPTPSDGKEAVDRRSIILEQEALIKEVYRANPNTVVVLISSFPFAITWTDHHVPAIVHLTHNSQELGNALADVLFGDASPGGRLVQTWPRAIEQLPPRLDYDLRNGRTYMYFRGEPLYPFGYGLSYTTFAYANLRLSTALLQPEDCMTVSVDVTNTGTRAGDEVVQLYVHHLNSAVDRPAKALKGFRRLTLLPGETHTVKLVLSWDALSHWNPDAGRFETEAGTVRVMVGSSAATIHLVEDIEIAD
ncbi:MAG: glycoside hydrolase family 3 C-terminal domain-containing protein [Anaerolineae bacterium]|nr:glycoside hydrolase family 3 C-terminal domain-containing protein [Anaerolineae bacterium]